MYVPDDLEIYWEGPDGDLFHVTGGEFEGKEGITLGTGDAGSMWEDLYEAPFETIYHSTAFQIGGDYGGFRENMFEFSLAFHIKPTADKPWRINESRFRKALDKKRDCKLHVKIPEVSHRWLKVRLRSTPKLKVKNDPNKLKYGLLLVHLVASYPRWEEDPWTDSFEAETDTTGGGTEAGNLTIANPTDNEQWIKYMAQAGNEGVIWTLPDFSFGDDRWERPVADADRMIEMPELINGEHIAVDTDELTKVGQVNSSLDTEVYLRMDGREFLYPIPAKTDPMQLPVMVTEAEVGNGIQARVPLNWSRPWGME